jgi:hypothetical protein
MAMSEHRRIGTPISRVRLIGAVRSCRAGRWRHGAGQRYETAWGRSGPSSREAKAAVFSTKRDGEENPTASTTPPQPSGALSSNPRRTPKER